MGEYHWTLKEILDELDGYGLVIVDYEDIRDCLENFKLKLDDKVGESWEE